MTQRTAGRVANAVAITTLLLMLVSSFPPLRRVSSDDPGDIGYIIGIAVGLGFYLAIGRAIVRRDPGNTIGWLLLLIPLLMSLSLTAGVYATTALVDRPGTLPLGIWAAWLDRWLLPVAISSFIYIFLLYPDGHLPSRRWRPALILTVVSTAITTVSFALTPGRMTGSQAHLETIHVNNPLGLSGLSGIVGALTVVGSLGLMISAVLACAALVVRYRGAQAETRQQIRWLRLVGVTFLITLAVTFVAGAAGAPDAVGNILFNLMFASLALGIPAACGVAILKYRLYDLDIVVRKTVVLAVVAGAITIVYAVVAVGIPLGDPRRVVEQRVRRVPARRGGGRGPRVRSGPPSRPAIRRPAGLGERATPYEVLSSFGERVGDTYATDDVCRAWRVCWHRARVRTQRPSGCASPASCCPRPRGRRARARPHPAPATPCRPSPAMTRSSSGTRARCSARSRADAGERPDGPAEVQARARPRGPGRSGTAQRPAASRTCGPRVSGSWPRRTRSVAGSSATSTTARSSSWWRSRCS